MKDDLRTTGHNGLRGGFNTPANKPIITVDVEKYQTYLDGSGMTQAEKEEFLQALWEIIVSFVELGFGVHPLQEVCGKDAAMSREHAKAAFEAVCSEKEQDEKTNDFSP